MDYDQTTVPNRYHKARQLSPRSASLWRKAILRHVPISEVDSIVDLGSGTGRFTELLAEAFEVEVVGVEPSDKMREQAAVEISSPHVQFRKGNAGTIPVDSDAAHLLFMSMVFHHIEDRAWAVGEIKRVLRKGGFLCIRNYTHEALSELPYLKFFPAARNVDVSTLPSRREFQSIFSKAEFETVAHEVVVQPAAPNAQAYFDKIAQRAYSDLSSISDAEFEAGLQAMKEKMNLADKDPVMEPVDFFVFRK